jgi:hypothetical protein
VTDATSSMPQPLTVSIPHQLGREEAKRRLDSGISRLRTEFVALVTTLDCDWHEDTMSFRVNILWQAITGRVTVLDDAVHIEIDLPWLMRLIADTVRKQARERTLLMLEKPAG